jgi:hypothetical protein
MASSYSDVPPGGIVNIPPAIPSGMLHLDPLRHSQPTRDLFWRGCNVRAHSPRRRHSPPESTRHPMPPQSVLGVTQTLVPGAATAPI